MSIFKVRLVGTAGCGKKSLAYELLRHMGEGGPVDDDDNISMSATPKQAAIINNQRCMLECEDKYVAEDEDDDAETSQLIPKKKKDRGGPKLRKKDNIFDKAKMQRGLAKAKMAAKLDPGKKEEVVDLYPTGYIVVFDIGDITSFQEAERQLDLLNVPPTREDQLPNHMVLVGNKTDKARRYRRITYPEGLGLAQKYPDVPYFETSAKLYQRVDQAFLSVVKKVQTSVVVPEVATSGTTAEGSSSAHGATPGAGGAADNPEAAIHGAADGSDLKEGSCFHKTFCCKCCPVACRRCGKRCGKSICVVM